MTRVRRIAIATDFGAGGPYVGQMRLVLDGLAPRIPVVELVSDLPPFRPDLAAYFLPALARDLPDATLYLCVVDPGVGGHRAVIALEADGNWYVGPDNGLLALVARRAARSRVLRVDWRPERLSDSFHGRDLFSPVAAMLSRGEVPKSAAMTLEGMVGFDWPADLPAVVYVDGYGNLITGVRFGEVPRGATLHSGGRELAHARTFCEVAAGAPFWYGNSFGLVEIAVNQGRADRLLGLAAGDSVGFPRRVGDPEFPG